MEQLKKTRNVWVYFTQAEYLRLKKASELTSLKISSFIRFYILKEIKKILRKEND